jgi:hypothetical protein
LPLAVQADAAILDLPQPQEEVGPWVILVVVPTARRDGLLVESVQSSVCLLLDRGGQALVCHSIHHFVTGADRIRENRPMLRLPARIALGMHVPVRLSGCLDGRHAGWVLGHVFASMVFGSVKSESASKAVIP